MQRQGNVRRHPARRTSPASSSPASSKASARFSKAEPSRWAPGDSVCALVRGRLRGKRDRASPQCPGSSRHDAGRAAVPETYFTVWTNVFQRGQLATGETILIHGGSSGIGTTAIQLARAFGAVVYVTAGTDECRACRPRRAGSHQLQDVGLRRRRFAADVGARVNVILDIGRRLRDAASRRSPSTAAWSRSVCRPGPARTSTCDW